MSGGTSRRREQVLGEKEKTWDLGAAKAPYSKYDALRDPNLRQYFESRQVQQFLHNSGWVDREGRIVDLDKHKSKLNIIEQEFKYAEKAEYWRMKEEEEMRRVIQAKRHRALEEAKRAERLARLKEERRVRQSIIRAMQLSKGVGLVSLPDINAPNGRVRRDGSHSAMNQTHPPSSYHYDNARRREEQELDRALSETMEASKNWEDGGGAAAGGGFFLTAQR